MDGNAFRVGVYGKYSHSETTFMACRLANWLSELGSTVSFISSGKAESGVHFQFDGLVPESRKLSFRGWSASLDTLVWFEPDAAKITAAVTSGCRNILVLTRQMPREEARQTLPAYDEILCTTRSLFDWVGRIPDVPRRRTHYLPWDSLLRQIPQRAGPVEKGKLRALLYVDPKTAAEEGGLICSTMRMLLEATPRLRIGLLGAGGWHRDEFLSLKRMVRESDGRFEWLPKLTELDRVAAYWLADWFIDLSLPSVAGFFVHEALCAGCGTVAFESTPATEFLVPYDTGILIPCSKPEFDGERPKMQSWALLDTLMQALQDDAILCRLQQQPYTGIEQQRRDFMEAWKQSVGLAESAAA